jgi:hypothetical protein
MLHNHTELSRNQTFGIVPYNIHRFLIMVYYECVIS